MFEDFSLINKNIGELRVSKNEDLKKANEDTGEIYEDGNIFSGSSLKSTREDVKEAENEYLQYALQQIMESSKGFQRNVETKDIVSAMFSAQDLSETGIPRAENQAGQIMKQVQKTINNAQTFDDVHIYDGKPEDLQGKLSDKQTKEYLESDAGKAALEEIGIEKIYIAEQEMGGAEETYSINGQLCNVEMGEDGTLRVSFIEKKGANSGVYGETGQYSDRAVDFKLNDPNIPKAEEPIPPAELETVQKYSVDSYDIDLQNHLKENGIDTEIYADTIQTLIRNQGNVLLPEEFGSTEIGQKLEQTTGKKIEDLTFFGNHVHYTDEQGVEHQFYYDNKSGEFINANVIKNDKGGYDVEVNMQKAEEPEDSQAKLAEMIKALEEKLEEINKKIEELLNKNNETVTILPYDPIIPKPPYPTMLAAEHPDMRNNSDDFQLNAKTGNTDQIAQLREEQQAIRQQLDEAYRKMNKE